GRARGARSAPEGTQGQPEREVVRLMNERDRLLAEGPRVAPEPASADESGRIVPSSRKRSPSWIRFAPAAAVGLVVLVSSAAAGHADWIWVAFVVIAIALQVYRRRKI